MDGTYFTNVNTREYVHLGRGDFRQEECEDGSTMRRFIACSVDDSYWRMASAGKLAWLNAAKESGAEIEAVSSDAYKRAYGRIIDAREIDDGCANHICVAVALRVERLVDRSEFGGVYAGIDLSAEIDGVYYPVERRESAREGFLEGMRRRS